VSQPYTIEGHAVRITTSAGVGIYPVHGEDADTLMKSADLALYVAKRAGKNTFRIAECTDLPAAARIQHDSPAFSAPLPDTSERMKGDQ
jgi:predicted signal transduction protein with EAL and GGDEF domain